MQTRPTGYMDSYPIVPRIEEANGTPVWKAKEEGGTPDIETTGKTLALMQTVVMSFGRNQSLGKPDLPIHHTHEDRPALHRNHSRGRKGVQA